MRIRPNFVWHLLLQSFATLVVPGFHEGLIGNQDNYKRVTFNALSELPSDEERSAQLLAVFHAAKIRSNTTGRHRH